MSYVVQGGKTLAEDCRAWTDDDAAGAFSLKATPFLELGTAGAVSLEHFSLLKPVAAVNQEPTPLLELVDALTLDPSAPKT